MRVDARVRSCVFAVAAALGVFAMLFARLRVVAAVILSLGIAVAAPTRATAQNTIVYSWSSNVGALNPHLYSPNQMFAQGMLYEPLVRYTEGGQVVPWLAKSWEISDDGAVYTFRLRDDVVFSDGTPFDAAAVKQNFDTVLRNRPAHEWLDLVNQIDHAEALDTHTFRLVMKRAYYPALQELALIRPLRFLSPEAFPDSGNTADGIKAPIGTGPWTLIETQKGEYDIFARNERYWGPKPSVDRIVVKVIPDPNTRAIALETGDIDLIYGSDGQISVDNFNRFKAQGDYTTAVSNPIATRALAINSNRAPTDDLAVRHAIQHAIDKDAIVENILGNMEPKADTLFASNFPYTDLGLKPYGYDPALSARLLDEAGWKLPLGTSVRSKGGASLVFDLCFVGTDAQQKAIAEVIQADLRKIGIAVNLIGEEKTSFYARQKDGQFGMIFGETWGAPYDPHSFASSMRAPSHADYQAQLGLPMKAEIDEMIGQALVALNDAQRQELYGKILGTLHDQAVYLPVSYITAVIVHNIKLSDVQFGATKYEIPFETMSVK